MANNLSYEAAFSILPLLPLPYVYILSSAPCSH